MPKIGSKVKFCDGNNQFKVPFTIYADFESALIPVEDNEVDDRVDDRSFMKKINQHIPTGFCAYSKFAYGKVKDPLKLYCGEDCIEQFCDHVVNEVKQLYDMFLQKEMELLTKKGWKEYGRAKNCHICMKPFDNNKDNNIRVRDHCHYTGKYRGAAHKICNLRFKILNHIPVVFHNLSGYDAHLFIRQLGKKYEHGSMGVIAKNREKYISFNVNVVVDIYEDKNGDIKEKKIQLRFIDSIRFMASSLDSLSSNLVGVSNMKCATCSKDCKFTHIDSDYVAHGKCKNCSSGYSKRKLNREETMRISTTCVKMMMRSLDYY